MVLIVCMVNAVNPEVGSGPAQCVPDHGTGQEQVAQGVAWAEERNDRRQCDSDT